MCINIAHDPARFTALADRLSKNAAAIKYGSVSVTLRLHAGRIVDVTHAVTEQTKGVKDATAD